MHRTPVLIFLSDGRGSASDQQIQDICNKAISLGSVNKHHSLLSSFSFLIQYHSRPLSFHTISFGPWNGSLRRMAEVAGEVQRANIDPTRPTVPSSYIEAEDTVCVTPKISICSIHRFCIVFNQVVLAETFLGIAESLRKPRGSLIRMNP